MLWHTNCVSKHYASAQMLIQKYVEILNTSPFHFEFDSTLFKAGYDVTIWISASFSQL